MGLSELLSARLALPAGVAARLIRYGELLLEANKRLNLTGAKSDEEIAVHIEDSLAVLPFVYGSLVDVGSGGGLPAIPLAIASGLPVTMIESTGKKARFLAETLSTLGLAGEVIVERAEVAAREDRLRERFASGTARAVASAPAVAELLSPFIAIGGAAVLQRGAMGERERNALGDAALVLGSRVEEERLLDGNRRLIVLRKVAGTPERFPRRPGVPRKRPLCF
jgi:16S rRNA (guanine527-N7)-methyltransferase